MGVSQKAFNWHQRKRANTMSMKNRMEGQAALERAPPTRDVIQCKACGFKVRYPFIRCPECNEVRKE